MRELSGFGVCEVSKHSQLDWGDWYHALKHHDIDIYRRTIEWMESVTLQNQVPTNIAADYERTAVLLVCEILRIKPIK